MSREPFLERLRRGPAILGDGAWGTMLFARGLPTGDAPERVCLERPELLTEIAGLYLEAGAEVVTTNTFGANPERLGLHGLADRLEEICRAAVSAVRRAVGERAWVSGSIGPTGQPPRAPRQARRRPRRARASSGRPPRSPPPAPTSSASRR